MQHGLSIKDIIAEARTEGDQSEEGEATEYADPTNMQFSPDYFSDQGEKEEEIEEDEEREVAFIEAEEATESPGQAEVF